MLNDSISKIESQSNKIKPIRDALTESSEFPHIRIVRDYGMLRSIGRLRHAQFVLAQGKQYKSEVSDTDCLIEMSDFSDINIYATNATGLTAAMRVGTFNNASNLHRKHFEDVACTAGIDLNKTLAFSRLVRSQSHAGGHVVDLINFVRLQTVTAGYRYGIMQTAERLIPFFSRFDFYPTGVSVEDPASGIFHLMIVDCGTEPVQNRRFRHVD